jgi:hypothetical protein
MQVYIYILTTFVELVIFFKDCAASVLSTVINVDCVVRNIFSFTSFLFVMFLNNNTGNSLFCSCCSIDVKKCSYVSNN